jgi:hypothetical protein
VNLRIDDKIVVEGRVLVVRVYLEDEATGELVTESMARLQQAEPAIRLAFERDARGYRTPTVRQDE